MSASDAAIVAALIFARGTLSARLERFDVIAPITFVLAGLLRTHGPLAPLGSLAAGGTDDAGLPPLPARRLIRRAS